MGSAMCTTFQIGDVVHWDVKALYENVHSFKKQLWSGCRNTIRTGRSPNHMMNIPRIEKLRHGNPFTPTPGRVRYAPRWLGVGAGAVGLSALFLMRGGRLATVALGVAGLAGAAYAMLYEPSHPRLERISLRFENLPAALDGLRIGHLSDLHVGHRFAAENTRWAVSQMRAEAPDILAITGDLVSYHKNIADLPGLLAPLRAPLGVYAVAGNHDHWEGLPEMIDALRPLGVEFLMNTQRRLHWRGAELTVAGVDDVWEGDADLDAAPQGSSCRRVHHPALPRTRHGRYSSNPRRTPPALGTYPRRPYVFALAGFLCPATSRLALPSGTRLRGQNSGLREPGHRRHPTAAGLPA